MPLPQQDPQPRRVDVRSRIYHQSTPGGVDVFVGLGGTDDPAVIEVRRPFGSIRAPLTFEEAWALWALLGDGLGVSGEPPAWLPDEVVPTEVDGTSLSALRRAVAAKPF